MKQPTRHLLEIIFSDERSFFLILRFWDGWEYFKAKRKSERNRILDLLSFRVIERRTIDGKLHYRVNPNFKRFLEFLPAALSLVRGLDDPRQIRIQIYDLARAEGLNGCRDYVLLLDDSTIHKLLGREEEAAPKDIMSQFMNWLIARGHSDEDASLLRSYVTSYAYGPSYWPMRRNLDMIMQALLLFHKFLLERPRLAEKILPRLSFPPSPLTPPLSGAPARRQAQQPA